MATTIRLVGLGRICANLARRWPRAGHAVVGHARTAAAVEGLGADGALDAGAARTDLDVNAEISPQPDRERYQFEFDVPVVAEVWRRGGVRMGFRAHIEPRKDES